MNGSDAEWEEFKRSLTTLQKASSIREQLNVLSAQLNEIEQDTKNIPEIKEALEADAASEENEEVLQNEDPAAMMQGAMGGGMPPMGGGMSMPEEEQAPPEDERASIGKADLAGGVDSTGTEPVADAVNMDTGDDKVQALFEQLIAALSESSHQALDAGDVGKLMKLSNAQANLSALLESIAPLLASVPENDLGGGEPVAKSGAIQKKDILSDIIERTKNQRLREPVFTPTSPQYPEQFPASDVRINRGKVDPKNAINARNNLLLPTSASPTEDIDEKAFIESVLANIKPDPKQSFADNYDRYEKSEDVIEPIVLGMISKYSGQNLTPESLRQAISDKLGRRSITDKVYREALHQIANRYMGLKPGESELISSGRTREGKEVRRAGYEDQRRYEGQNITDEERDTPLEFGGLPVYNEATDALKSAKKVKRKLKDDFYTMSTPDKFENYVLPNIANNSFVGRTAQVIAPPSGKLTPEKVGRYLSSYGTGMIPRILRGLDGNLTDAEIKEMNPAYLTSKRLDPRTGKMKAVSMETPRSRQARVKDLEKELDELTKDSDYINYKARFNGINPDAYFADLEAKIKDRDQLTGLMRSFSEAEAEARMKLKDPAITPEERSTLEAQMAEYNQIIPVINKHLNEIEQDGGLDIDSEREDYNAYKRLDKNHKNLTKELEAAKAYAAAGKTPKELNSKAQKLFDYLTAAGVISGDSLNYNEIAPMMMEELDLNPDSPDFFQDYILGRSDEYQNLSALEGKYHDFVGYVKSLVGSDPSYENYYLTDGSGKVIRDENGKPMQDVRQMDKYESVYRQLESDLKDDPLRLHYLELCRSKGVHPIRFAEAISFFDAIAKYQSPDESSPRGTLSEGSAKMLDEAAEILAKPWASALPVRYIFNAALADDPIENLNTDPLNNIQNGKQGRYVKSDVINPRYSRWVTNQGLNGPARLKLLQDGKMGEGDLAVNSPLLRKLESEKAMDFFRQAAPLYTQASGEILGELAPYMKRYMELTNTNPEVGPIVGRRKREAGLDALMADLSAAYDDLESYDPYTDQAHLADEMAKWQKEGYTYDTIKQGDNAQYADSYHDFLRLHSSDENPFYIYATKTPSTSGPHYNYEIYDSEEAWKDSKHADSGGKFTDMLGYSGKISNMPKSDLGALQVQQLSNIPVPSERKFDYTRMLADMAKTMATNNRWKKEQSKVLRPSGAKGAQSAPVNNKESKSESESNKEMDLQQAIASGNKNKVLREVNKKEDKKDGDGKATDKD